MASNPRSPVCRPPSDLKPGSKVTHPGQLSPLRTYCTLQIVKSYPREERWHKTYRFRSSLSSATWDDAESELGFVNSQPLTQQKVNIMRLQRPDVFPLCRGVDRYWDDVEMYPQYGDLQSQLFKHDRAPFPHHLQKQRAILLSRHWIESVRVPSAQNKGESRQSQEQRRLGESSGESSRHVDGEFRPAEDTCMEAEIGVSER